jgi:hypothetical protein
VPDGQLNPGLHESHAVETGRSRRAPPALDH